MQASQYIPSRSHHSAKMKYSSILGLTAAATLVAASPMKRQSSFAHVDGLKFNIDGVTKYYAGTNSYWLGFTTGDADIDTALDRIQESGLKLVRIWGFNDVNTVPTDGRFHQMHNHRNPLM